MTLALRLTDTKEDFGLELRRGVVQLHRTLPPHADVTLSAPAPVLREILLGQRSFAKDWLFSDVQVDGSVRDVARFFSYFERPGTTQRHLALH